LGVFDPLGNKGCVCQSHCGLAIYIKKYLKAKEEFYGNSNISPCKNILIFIKIKINPLKETKFLQDSYNSITNLSSFNTSQNTIIQKSSYKNRLIILPRGQNPFSY
jgi:hypothetical protein